ncbi:MAG: cobalt transporter, partial [Nocardioides sp.]|nr:cobalt transporter [Nocardioides sp.]
VAFGAGLALVLFAVGLVALAGSSWLARAGESRRALDLASRLAPALAAVGLIVLGGVISALALSTLLA